jgi:hypothetical protein
LGHHLSCSAQIKAKIDKPIDDLNTSKINTKRPHYRIDLDLLDNTKSLQDIIVFKTFDLILNHDSNMKAIIETLNR